MYIRCSHGIDKFYSKNLDRGEQILATFLDLTKAFHCVFFVIILQIKLIRVWGIPLSWIKSYVGNRMKTVQLSNKISDSQEKKLGVPQGSVYGPILLKIHHYADDTTLCLKNKYEVKLLEEVFVEGSNCPIL